jgi:hypothetical protein
MLHIVVDLAKDKTGILIQSRTCKKAPKARPIPA